MKKVLFTIIATMAFTLSFAETKSNRVDNPFDGFSMSFINFVDNRFDMNFDIRRLAAKLDLTESQMEAVEIIQDQFADEVQSLASMRGPRQRHLVHQAVRKDVQQMQRVLNDEQFSTYMMLLGATLQNKHL